MMKKIRRAPVIHFMLEARLVHDLSQILAGKHSYQRQDQLIATVGSSDREIYLDPVDMQILLGTSTSEWSDKDELVKRLDVELELIDQLLKFGLLISDDQSPNASEQELLAMWDSGALFYHKRSRWKGVGKEMTLPENRKEAEDWSENSPKVFDKMKSKYGAAPPAFLELCQPSERINMDITAYQSPLTECLHSRHTTRFYDTTKALGLNDISTLLYQVFGCHGVGQLSGDLKALKKTSPSGGALHPIEVYPLVIKADGLSSGLYHYHVGDHALEPMQDYSEEEARNLVTSFSAGQKYYSSAQVVLIYTARYERNFWKYRKNLKAYKVIQMDLGHLSQSLYLMCADLGLGAFFTAACNDIEIDEELKIDGMREGAIGMGGFGIPDPDGAIMNFSNEPYIPRSDKP